VSPADDGVQPTVPGARFLAEIHEQPAALRGLLAHEDVIVEAARLVTARDARLIRFVGHGSSDNAASFGVYAFGLLPRWTAMRDAITLTVHYDTPLDMTGSTVIGLSQSGRTIPHRSSPPRRTWRSPSSRSPSSPSPRRRRT